MMFLQAKLVKSASRSYVMRDCHDIRSDARGCVGFEQAHIRSISHVIFDRELASHRASPRESLSRAAHTEHVLQIGSLLLSLGRRVRARRFAADAGFEYLAAGRGAVRRLVADDHVVCRRPQHIAALRLAWRTVRDEQRSRRAPEGGEK